MDDKIYKVALAGLLHDIGKLMQRAELEKELTEIEGNYDEFCPISDSGRYSYLHAAHTAYFIEKFIPEFIISKKDKEELYNAARHHKNSTGDIYREADILSAGMERYSDERDLNGYKKVRLHSIFDAIELQYTIHSNDNRLNSRWHYHLASLSDNNCEVLFPVINNKERQIADIDLTYRELWDRFSKELEKINLHDDIKTYFNRVYYLIEKYTWCIPSATNVFPDISLFDHLKTTASIASCFFFTQRDKIKKDREFILYAGDISGIQDYIFKISGSQGIGGISKRLRGRSFYIAMLAEVLSRYIINNLNLTVANINYCGGGNFEILLPNTRSVVNFLDNFSVEINQWLFEKFHGSLGYESEKVEMTTGDLRDRYGEKKDALSEKLQVAKLRKSRSQLNEESFWVDKIKISGKITACPSCKLELLRDNETICELCQQDKAIGQFLPQAEYLVFLQSNIHCKDSGRTIMFGKFGSVALLSGNINSVQSLKIGQTTYSVSEKSSDDFSRYYFAQTLPIAIKTIGPLETEKDEDTNGVVLPDQTLSFSTLADMAEGDKRIGILKMDVDNLGLIFSLGLNMPESSQNNFRSISRLSSLSRQLALFFSIHVDDLCRQVFKKWQNESKNTWQHKMDVSNIFYLIFSGGDDLVIVGPWDRTIELSQEIHKAFKNFTCHNPNITLSAGIYICKPKFPITIAVEKAEEALNQSKDKGRNRITVMGETAVWDEEDEKSRIYQEELRGKYPGSLFSENEIYSEKIYMAGKSRKGIVETLTFTSLSEFSEQLQKYYEGKYISRHFIFSLLSAKEAFFTTSYNDDKNRFEEVHNQMVLPQLLYNIERNAAESVKSELKKRLVTTGEAQKYIRQVYYPCKTVLMKTKNT